MTKFLTESEQDSDEIGAPLYADSTARFSSQAEWTRQDSFRQRSTLHAMRGTIANLAKSVPDFSRALQARIRRNHAYSTMALCLSIISHAYLLMNPFPYAGFMAVRLLKNVSVDSAGGPAGILLACYMIGKAVTAMRQVKEYLPCTFQEYSRLYKDFIIVPYELLVGERLQMCMGANFLSCYLWGYAVYSQPCSATPDHGPLSLSLVYFLVVVTV